MPRKFYRVYHPKKLPLKDLEWDAFQDLLWKAHGELGRWDQALRESSRVRKKKQPLTLALFCKLHRKILLEAKNIKEAGKFRTRQNWIGPEGCSCEEGYFFPPNFKQVPRYMQNLKQYINSKEKDPLVQLAIFFAQLLIIHPFMDGNGRLARLLIPIILHKKEVLSSPIFEMDGYFKKNRGKYFEKLFQISSKNDWEGWIRFFLEGIIEKR
ncbi:MAG: Fic family protein [Rhabdochlamydiaceae bacterium]|nr:Fic family protein [Rhabdochlamydiaceae bacterium]